MLRGFLFDLLIGRRLRRFGRRRRRLTPLRIVRWAIGKVVATLVTFAIVGVLVMWYFHQGAMEAILAGDASLLSAIPFVIARWFELGVAFVVAALVAILPGGGDHDGDGGFDLDFD